MLEELGRPRVLFGSTEWSNRFQVAPESVLRQIEPLLPCEDTLRQA